MSKVFLYSRVSTDQQSLEQQERTVYEWLCHHHMTVDEIVSDEGVSGGIGYAERKLGKELLPKMESGDTLIVSEISRLGRSMFNLSKLIHEELKPRKIRLVVVSMGIDLRCDNLTAMDELIINQFAFAAQLEKQLISERTKSALAVKKAAGVKLGGANEKYKQIFASKSAAEIARINKSKGRTRNERHKKSLEFIVMTKITRQLFPDATQSDDPREWKWAEINFSTHGDSDTFLDRMRAFKELDTTGELFKSFDFDNDPSGCKKYLHPFFRGFRKSIFR